MDGNRHRGRRLRANKVTLGYPRQDSPVLREVTAEIPPGAMTAIVGPNGCGKSTLLRALGRILRPQRGTVDLDGRVVADFSSKEFARQVGFLAQGAVAPDSITVGDLVSRGRFPYQGIVRQWSCEDEQAVVRALHGTGTWELADREVTELSGGQRQRVWIAMVLAQDTDVLLLDEPTTFLDLGHQLEVLELCRRLNTDTGTTIVAVLHDLDQAARYADHMIAMCDGEVVAVGSPEQVLTAETVARLFGVDTVIGTDPETGTPTVVPRAGSYARRVNR